MAGEWLFPVPGAALQSQGTELTAHKTGEPWPKLPEGTGDMVGARGLWAAQGIRDSGFGSKRFRFLFCDVQCHCLILSVWAIPVSLEAAAPLSALAVLCFMGSETVMQGAAGPSLQPHLQPKCTLFFLPKNPFPSQLTVSAGEG